MNTDKVLTIAELAAFLAVAYVLYLLWDELSSAGGALASWLSQKNDAVNAWIEAGASPPGFVQTGTASDGTPIGHVEIHQDPADTAEIIGNQAHDGLDPYGALTGSYT